MLLKSSISRRPETHTALDQQQLYAMGLDHVRRLSRGLWTDHNIHDPGITILELLCYALTDLSYRAQFPIEDLLAAESGNAASMEKQFVTARRILPNRALTLRDYRKLLIDLKDVKNAWVLPAGHRLFADTVKGILLETDPKLPGVTPVDLQGLYKVLLEYDESVATASRKKEIREEAMALLQANRNLCEDFVSIGEAGDQYYTLCADLDLEPQADASEIAARIRFAVEQYLTPPVANNTLSEMRARRHPDGTPYTPADIFDGPLLRHGFIDDAELDAAEMRTEIRLSDIIRLIMAIEGVRAVRDIVLNPLEPGNAADSPAVAPADKWVLEVPAGKQPRLTDKQGRLVFHKRGIPVTADASRAESILAGLYATLKSKLHAVSAEDIPIPLGRYRNVASYKSFQHHFPVLYGLSDQGLQDGADEVRRAQALQLKAYLLFFDQAMANHFSQLANLGDLFSTDPMVAQTYFTQVVDSFPDALKVYPAGISKGILHGMLETDQESKARRNRFLDHLMARYAEDFSEYLAIMQSVFGAGSETAISAKCAFLKDFPQSGGERSLASNVSLKEQADLWNSYNVSGLEKRLTRLLGITNFGRRNLSEISHTLYAEVDKTPGDEFRFRIKHPVTGKILLSSSTKYATQEAAREEMLISMERSKDPSAYQRKVANDGKRYFNILGTGGQVIARRIEYFDTAAEMNAAIDEVIAQMRDHHPGEGMYVIENILLRPGQAGDPLLHVCVDPGCPDCSGLDPYSYRLHFILPEYAGRFHNMEFRRFVEETIRTETPAHILPKICWVSAADMAVIEVAYREWLEALSGATSAGRKAKIKALIEALEHSKNVYPAPLLRDCGEDPSKPPIILGRSSLGSDPGLT
jgi:hypothetical protein